MFAKRLDRFRSCFDTERRKIVKASLTYKVAWIVKLTLIDGLACNVIERVELALKGPMLALRESVLALRVPMLVFKRPASVLDTVLWLLEGIVFVVSEASVVSVGEVRR